MHPRNLPVRSHIKDLPKHGVNESTTLANASLDDLTEMIARKIGFNRCALLAISESKTGEKGFTHIAGDLRLAPKLQESLKKHARSELKRVKLL